MDTASAIIVLCHHHRTDSTTMRASNSQRHRAKGPRGWNNNAPCSKTQLQASTILCSLTFIVVLWHCVGSVNAFNLDPGSAKVFEGPADSYFGFSLSLHANSDGDWLLVGAPKAEDIYQSSVNTSGALYKCPLNQGAGAPCSQIKLDDSGNRQNAQTFVQRGQHKLRIRFSDHKDNQWLGVTVDSHQNGDGGVVTCGHKWGDRRYQTQGFLMVNGACYRTDGSFRLNATQRLLPLTQNGRQVNRRQEYLYAYGQAGMAAAFTQNGKSLLIGAPGIKDWTGGVVESITNNDYVAYPDGNVPKAGYIGYAVAAGEFFGTGETHFVAGGPRIDVTGRVFIYKNRFSIVAELLGQQMGEYFGAAICVTDLNQDGLDDLLVGAPLHSSRMYEEGRVAVYLVRFTHVFEHVMDLQGSESPGARFGTAIAAVDLTMDGYPDIVIGAPYEEGQGAIYVYNSDVNGLRQTASQRLVASQVNPGLTGFGHALSTTKSTSGRHAAQFPNIAVGSYASNMAAVMSVRPLVVVQVNASTHPALINPRVANCYLNNQTHSPRSCLVVGVAFKYTGAGLPDRLSFTVKVRADIIRQDDPSLRQPLRGGFQNGTMRKQGMTKHPLSEFTALVQEWPANQAWKDHFMFVLSKHVVDVITPVDIAVEVDLIEPEASSSNTNGGLQPLLDKYCHNSMVLVVPFDKFCGDDNHCHTDLQLHTSVQWPSHNRNYVILGQQEPISIEIHVNNVGEKAYMTNLTVLHPSELVYSGIRAVDGSSRNQAALRHITCTPHTLAKGLTGDNGDDANAALVCEIGNPIPDYTMRSLAVVFTRPEVYPVESFRKDRMFVTVQTRTRSQEAYLGNNDVTLVLPVTINAEMDLTGVSYPEQHVYEVESKSNSSMDTNSSTSADINSTTVEFLPVIRFPEVYHTYDLRNEGPGIFPGGHIDVTLPVQSLEGEQLVEYIVEILDDATTRSRPNLADQNARRKRRDIQADDKDTSGARSSNDVTSSPDLGAPEAAQPARLFGRSRLLPLDLFCSSARCQVSRHVLGPLNAGESVTISIFIRLHMQNLVLLQDTGAVRVLSQVQLHSHNGDNTLPTDLLQVGTLVTPRHAVIPDSSVPWWVVAASVGVGLFLLLIVVAVLYKFGFFTRVEREEMVKLIGQNEENEQQEARMFGSAAAGGGATDPRGASSPEWEAYDPWQPQSPETRLLIWHANGSVSHSSREEYLAAIPRRSSSSTHDRNWNEKGKGPGVTGSRQGINRNSLDQNLSMNGSLGRSHPTNSLPSTSGSSSGDNANIRGRNNRHSMTSHDDDEVFFDVHHNSNHNNTSIPHYLVIRPASEDSDEIDTQWPQYPPPPVPNGRMMGSRL